MATVQQIIIGTSPNDGTGDSLRDGGLKTNQNVTNLNNAIIDTESRLDAVEIATGSVQSQLDTHEADSTVHFEQGDISITESQISDLGPYNNYTHPTDDGNKHVPANGITNEGKVLTAGAIAGTYTWEDASSGVIDHTLLTNIGTKTHVVLESELSTIDGRVDVISSQTASYDSHIISTTNPHSVDKTDVGLGNVDNTTDLNKPISTLTQTALDGKVDDAQVQTNVPAGAVFTDTVYDDTTIQGEVDLNTAKVGITTQQATDITTNNAKVSNVDHPLVETAVPSGAIFTDTVYTHPTGDGNEHVPATGTTNNGKVLTAGATEGTYTWELPVTGVTDHTLLTNIGNTTHVDLDIHVSDIISNPHQVDKSDVGLGNVDNTSDALKPISTATQTALDGKAATFTNRAQLDLINQNLQSGASPTFNATNITGIVAGASDQLRITVKKSSVGTIPIGSPVYIVDYNVSGWYAVEIADASDPNKMPAIGITSTPVDSTSSNQYVTTSGKTSGINTSTYTQNASLYIAAGGGLTITKPTGTNLIQKVGVASRIHSSAGVIQVVGAGRTNDVPNIPSNQVWLGNGSGVATATDIDTKISSNSAVSANTSKISYTDSTAVGLNTTHRGLTTGNPHNVTKTDLSIENVNNTSDANKPISTATQTALDLKADLVGGYVPASQLPSYVDSVEEYASEIGFPATGEIGKIYIALDTNLIYRWTGTVYVKISDVPSSSDIKSLYESNANTNVFLDAEKTKLGTIEDSATADQTSAEIKTAYESNANTNVFTDSEKTLLGTVESGATGDMTGAEIKTAYELELDTNAFTDSEKTKLSGIEDNATADQTGAQIKVLYEGELDTNAFTDADVTKLGGIETNATADQTGLEIKTAYESNGNTNAYTDLEKTKLGTIEESATADMTGAEIKTAYEANANTNVFTDSNVTKLSGIESLAEVNNISDVNATDLTDGGDTTLHYHLLDRSRSVHTGTQLASTISDFETAVGQNTDLLANTTHRTSDGKNHSDVVLNNSYRTVGHLPLTGGTLTGRINDTVNTVTVSSLTGSIDASLGNTFIVTLGQGVDTKLEVNNLSSGQTLNVKVTQNGTSAGTVTLGDNLLEPSGSSYTPSTTLGAVDILTIATFESSATAYVVNTKKFQ